MSAFFGNMLISLKTGISATTLSAVANATTSSLTASVSGGRGTYTYSWISTGTGCTITNSTAAATTFTGSGVTGTTSVYCAITDTTTGNTLITPSCTITWTATAPGIPTIGTASSGDKAFAINWTAPTNDGGSPITGYYVQNSTDGGNSWSTAILVGISTSYTWSGNGIVFNGNTYIGRVAAVNGIGTGSYSGVSSGAVPTFAAPSCSVTIQAGYPTITNPYRRPLTITINPTACVDYSYTQVYIFSSPYEDLGTTYSSYVQNFSGGPGVLFVTSSSAVGQTGNVYSIYQQNFFQGSQYFETGANIAYYVYVITFNNDGFGVQSSTATYTTPALVPYYTEANSTTQTSTVSVASRTYNSGVLYSIPDGDVRINTLTIFATTNSTSITICTTSRAFVVNFSGTSTSALGALLTGLQTPWSNNAGTAFRSLVWSGQSLGYGNASGAGRVIVRGRVESTLTSWANPQSVYVRVAITTRTLQYY
jgi:hypothetical protein